MFEYESQICGSLWGFSWLGHEMEFFEDPDAYWREDIASNAVIALLDAIDMEVAGALPSEIWG